MLEREAAKKNDIRKSKTTQLEKLRNYYKAGHATDWDSNLPVVPPPSMFQPDPFVVGSPEESRLAKTLLDLDPTTKQRVKNIHFGPTAASMRQMVRSELPIDRFAGTTLLGIIDQSKGHEGEIGINPGLAGMKSLNTMGHEIGHAAGYGEEGAEKAGDLIGGAKDVPLEEDPLEALVKALKAKGINAEIRRE